MRYIAASLSLVISCHAFSPSTNVRSQSTKLQQTKNDYNVVFRPSTNDEAFDSLKLGTARVHRYSDPNNPADDSEYIVSLFVCVYLMFVCNGIANIISHDIHKHLY